MNKKIVINKTETQKTSEVGGEGEGWKWGVRVGVGVRGQGGGCRWVVKTYFVLYINIYYQITRSKLYL